MEKKWSGRFYTAISFNMAAQKKIQVATSETEHSHR